MIFPPVFTLLPFTFIAPELPFLDGIPHWLRRQDVLIAIPIFLRPRGVLPHVKMFPFWEPKTSIKYATSFMRRPAPPTENQLVFGIIRDRELRGFHAD